MTLHAGTDAPLFELPDHTGALVRLADLRGKNVVLWFYPEAMTGGCTAEGCLFRDLHARFIENNTVILGLSFDAVEKNAKFVAMHEFPYALLSDVDRKVGLAYGAATTADQAYASRTGAIIDPNGKIVFWAEKVGARTFPDEALELLRKHKS